jgi:two-component system phosphate regulon sensor histidine kinase PhoR
MQAKAEEARVAINLEVPDDFPEVKADRDKMKQVILNLLSNAIKYNRPSGSVMLRADASETGLVIYIQDTGIGIPEEALPHLFQKFYRVREHEAKSSGTGLGLSICKQIVQGHGGRVEVKSKVGVGTVFSVILPRFSRTVPRREI